MKKTVYYLTLIAFVFVSTSAALSDADCDVKALKKEGISSLNPFYYSSSKVNTINYDSEVQRKEIEVPLFKGEKYRMVFNKKGLHKDVVIEIYDKDKTHSNRSPLYSSVGSEGDIISFEPEKAKKHYVNYVIPKGEENLKTGCMVFILGYQLTFIEDVEEDKEEE
jgi:hypothetical protein